MTGAGCRAACSLLAVAALLSTPCLATPTVTCFHSTTTSLLLPPSQTARAAPFARRSRRPEIRISAPLDPNDSWRQRLLRTALEQQGGANNGSRGKRRFFGMGGDRDNSNISSNNSNAEQKKQRRRDIFRRKDKDKQPEGKSNGKRGISVDINTFVGPRMPTDSEVSLKAMLNLSPEEEVRRTKAKEAFENAERKRREAKERVDVKVRAAAEKAKEEVGDRRREEQRQKEALERRKAVVRAASSSVSGANKGTRDDIKFKTEKSQGGRVLGGAQSFFSGVVGSIFGEKQHEEWIVICPKTRISPGEVVPVVAGGLDLLLVASRDGKRLACIANSCPHLGTPLETGIVERRPMESPASRKSDVTEDGCEDCIVCPTHQTAFALASGEVRGEWCPYPPVLGKMMGTIKTQTNLPTFSVRALGKNIEVRINSNLDDVKK